MGSDKSKGSGSGSIGKCSQVEFRGFNGKICGVEENQQTSMRDNLDIFKPSQLRSDEGTMLTSLKEGESKNLGFGDLVWGKVKSHPWWPGQIYDKNLVPPPLCNDKRCDGSVLVTFYGDYSYTWLDHDQIIPFEPHFEEKSKKSKRQTFIVAVEEAIEELKKREALGLTCFCQGNFHSINEGLYKVDVSGYAPGAIYSSKQIKKFRDGFQPHGMFSFVKKLARSPRFLQNIYGIINGAKVTAYRKVIFEEDDETYDQAFGAKASSSEDPPDFSKDGNQLKGSIGAQVEAETPNGPIVSFTSTGMAGLERNNSITMEKPCVDVEIEKSGPAALYYEHKDEASVYWKMRRSEESKILDKCKNSQALDVPIMITEEKLQNFKFPTLLFDASVNKEEEKSFEDQLDYSKESRKGEIKRKRMEESAPDDQGQKSKFQKDATFGNLVAKSGGETGGNKNNNGLNDHATPQNGGLLSDLLASACDPFYGAELGNAAGAFEHLKQFQSTLYQKSCPNEYEKTNKKQTLLKCQDEHMTRKEELRGLKSLHKRKKYGNQKLLTPKEGDDIDIQSTSEVKYERKFSEEPARKAEPTMLVIKFPSQTVLPTASEVNAKFAYFGPFDESATRISRGSVTCQIVFMYKSNAQAAYDYAVHSQTLFNSDVNYHLTDFDGSEKFMGESFDDVRSFDGEPHHMSFQEFPLQSDTETKSLPKENSKCRSDVEEEAFLKGNADSKSYPDVDEVNIGSEKCQVLLSKISSASSPVSSSIQYKHKVGSLDETVVAINAKYSMDEGWKSHYQQNLSAIDSSDLSLQLANLFQKCNEILGGMEGSQDQFSNQS